MSMQKGLLKTFTAAGVVALHLGAGTALSQEIQLPVPQPLAPDLNYTQPNTSPPPVIHLTPEGFRRKALAVGTALMIIHNSNDTLEREAQNTEMDTNLRELQDALKYYASQRQNYYFAALDPEGEAVLQTNGILDQATAEMFLDMASLEGLKEIFLDGPLIQDPAKATPFRFLRNRLKELAPEAFVRGLSAITLRSESQTQALQTDAFLHCSKGDRRLFSPNLVASEKEKIANNPAYISRLIEYGCAYYLEGLNKVISRTLQENFLSAHEDRRDSLKKDERGWCEIFVPDKTSLGHKCETFNL